jgi:hypothetical protein
VRTTKRAIQLRVIIIGYAGAEAEVS